MTTKKEFTNLDYRDQLIVLTFTKTILSLMSELGSAQEPAALEKDLPKVQRTDVQPKIRNK